MQQSNSNFIYIITARASFPNGFGATSIIHKYSKGFLANGYKCKILLLRPTETSINALNNVVNGVKNGVYFEYMSSTTHISKIKILKLFVYIKGTLRTLIDIFKHRNQIEIVFLYSPDYIISTFLIQLESKLLKIKCIGIKTESSYSDIHRISKSYWKIKENIIYKLFDEMIVITEYLIEQLRGFGYKKGIRVFPIIVDQEMFNSVNRRCTEKSIIYMGTLGYLDEIKLLIDIFEETLKYNQSFRLKIIGRFTNDLIKANILNFLNDKVSKNYIDFVGQVKYDDLPQYLVEGDIFILPRINNENSKAGFPIKLGEYLLTGKPVIVTSTGEIGKYLKNNYSAIIVDDNSKDEISRCLLDIMNNYDNYKEIGRVGKEVAIREFSAIEICRRIIGDNK